MKDWATAKKMDRNFSVNAEIANNLLKKIQDSYINKKAKNSMTRTTLLKLISAIYEEKLLNQQSNSNNPLHIMIYDLYLNKYGLKKIAETKYVQVNF